MQNTDRIENSITQLKKEVWYIARVTIPKLKKEIESISAPDLTGIKQTLTINTSKIASLDKKIEVINSDLFACQETLKSCQAEVSSLSGKTTQNGEEIQSINAQIESLSAQLNSCRETVSGFGDTLDSLLAKTSELSTTTSDLSTTTSELSKTTSELSATMSELSTTTGELSTATSELSKTTGTLSEDVEKIQNDATLMKQNLETLQQENETLTGDMVSVKERISSCETTSDEFVSHKSESDTWKAQIEQKLAELEAKTENAGEKIDVLYDMDSPDPNVNFGYTEGVIGNQYIDVDLKKYSKLRIYVCLPKQNDCIQTIDLKTRKSTEAAFIGVSSMVSEVYYLKLKISSSLARIAVNISGTYTTTTAGAVTFVRELGNKEFYMYRAEGIY